jgi:hypothetical protein
VESTVSTAKATSAAEATQDHATAGSERSDDEEGGGDVTIGAVGDDTAVGYPANIESAAPL